VRFLSRSLLRKELVIPLRPVQRALPTGGSSFSKFPLSHNLFSLSPLPPPSFPAITCTISPYFLLKGRVQRLQKVWPREPAAAKGQEGERQRVQHFDDELQDEVSQPPRSTTYTTYYTGPLTYTDPPFSFLSSPLLSSSSILVGKASLSGSLLAI